MSKARPAVGTDRGATAWVEGAEMASGLVGADLEVKVDGAGAAEDVPHDACKRTGQHRRRRHRRRVHPDMLLM